jgi:hypothetical protein
VRAPRAVTGPDAEQQRRAYYERTIQTLEQQLHEFQRQLTAGAFGGVAGGGMSKVDEESNSAGVSTDLIVAEYVHRATCALSLSFLLLMLSLLRCAQERTLGAKRWWLSCLPRSWCTCCAQQWYAGRVHHNQCIAHEPLKPVGGRCKASCCRAACRTATR